MSDLAPPWRRNDESAKHNGRFFSTGTSETDRTLQLQVCVRPVRWLQDHSGRHVVIDYELEQPRYAPPQELALIRRRRSTFARTN